MSDDISDADSLFDETFAAAEDVSEEIVESVEDATDEVGMTSDESDQSDELADSAEKKSLLSGFTLFDAMLGLAFLFITLATLLLFFELGTFGNVLSGEFPWRTPGF